MELPIWTLATLPLYHRDPFDRILIAQAITEGWTLVTTDASFVQYPVQILS
jgi:PIN domain nuclease of toxin-antitoxin system